MMNWQRLNAKRIALCSLAVLFLLGLTAGCTEDVAGGPHTPAATPDSGPSAAPSETAPSEPEADTALPGSYAVPEGWVKWETYSSKDKTFYVEEGHEDDELPDNISVEIKSNRYGIDEHESFRDAILRQLLMQTQGLDATLTGDGTYTQQDDILYIFTITEEDVITQQYYIVGDRQYCLIHLTSFTSSESTEEAARAMADSFVWN